jgi:hypothetical protein
VTSDNLRSMIVFNKVQTLFGSIKYVVCLKKKLIRYIVKEAKLTQ